MFPKELSDQVLSLGGDKNDGSATTTMFKIDDTGELLGDSFKVYLTKLCSVSKLTYEVADGRIASGGGALDVLCKKEELRRTRMSVFVRKGQRAAATTGILHLQPYRGAEPGIW